MPVHFPVARFTDEQRLRGLRWVIAAGFLAGFAFAPRLWLSTRSYPLTPILPLPALPFPLDYVGFALLVGLLIAGCVLSRRRWPLLAFVGLLGLLVLGDLLRSQPWVYLYGFIALVLGLSRDAGQALNIVRLIVVGTYFWSGIHKLNFTFFHELMPALLSGVLPPSTALEWGPVLGWPAALVEAGAAVGLLVGRVRHLAVALLLSMHAVILLLLGPFGLNFNSVVWPWNIAMSLLLLVLFARAPAISWREALFPGRSALHGLALVLFGVLPFLHRFDLWDLYLSSSLYSAMNSTARIFMTRAVAEKLPPDMKTYLITDGQTYALDFTPYTMGELNVPEYPEPRFYKAMARRICALADNPNDVVLLIVEPPTVLTGISKLTYLRCRDLE